MSGCKTYTHQITSAPPRLTNLPSFLSFHPLPLLHGRTQPRRYHQHDGSDGRWRRTVYVDVVRTDRGRLRRQARREQEDPALGLAVPVLLSRGTVRCWRRLCKEQLGGHQGRRRYVRFRSIEKKSICFCDYHPLLLVLDTDRPRVLLLPALYWSGSTSDSSTSPTPSSTPVRSYSLIPIRCDLWS